MTKPNPDDYFGDSKGEAKPKGKRSLNPDDYFGPIEPPKPKAEKPPGLIKRGLAAVGSVLTNPSYAAAADGQRLADAKPDGQRLVSTKPDAKPDEPSAPTDWRGVDEVDAGGGTTPVFQSGQNPTAARGSVLDRPAVAAPPDRMPEEGMLTPEFVRGIRSEFGKIQPEKRFDELRKMASGNGVKAMAARIILRDAEAENMRADFARQERPGMVDGLERAMAAPRIPIKATPGNPPESTVNFPETGALTQWIQQRDAAGVASRHGAARAVADDQRSIDALTQREQAAASDPDAKAFASENPMTSAVASGAANMLRGLDNIVPTVLDFASNLVGAKTSGAKNQSETSAWLERKAQNLMPEAGQQEMGAAWHKGEFGEWLMLNLAANAPQLAPTLVAAFVPGTQGAALGLLGGIAAGNKYADTGNSAAAVASGMVEGFSERLPLKYFERSAKALSTLPPAIRGKTVQAIGKALPIVGKHLTAQAIVGAIEEVVAQIGNNAIDATILEKDNTLLDGVAEAAVIGAFASGGLSLPQGAGAIRRAAQSPEQHIAQAIDQAASQYGLHPKAAATLRDKVAIMDPAAATAYAEKVFAAAERAGLVKKPGGGSAVRQNAKDLAAKAAKDAEAQQGDASGDSVPAGAAASSDTGLADDMDAGAILGTQAEAPQATSGEAPTEGATDGPMTDEPAQPGVEAGAAPPTPVDEAAHEAATSPHNDHPEPTLAQKEAGNYRKGAARIAGMNVSIENPEGSVRRGVARDGTPWENTMVAHYGYVRGTRAGDGDHSDIFIKPGTPEDYSGPAYVIDQIDPETGKFDEHKTVLGASSEDEARAIYQANYAPGWKGLAAITALPIDAYKSWVRDGVKRKPLGDINAVSGNGSGPRPGAGGNAQPGSADTSGSGGTVDVVQGELPQPGATGTAGAVVPGADAGNRPAATGPGAGNEALTARGVMAQVDAVNTEWKDLYRDAHPYFSGDGPTRKLSPSAPQEIKDRYDAFKRNKAEAERNLKALDAPPAAAPTLTAGQSVTVDGEPYTVKTAKPKVLVLTGADGKPRTITSDSATWAKVQPAGDRQADGRQAAGDRQLTTGPRILGKIGRTPNAAETVELRPNKDGTLTPHQGKYAMVDYETGEPVVIPGDSTNEQAIDAIKKSGAMGAKDKWFGVQKEQPDVVQGRAPVAQAQPDQEGAPAGGVEPAGAATAPAVPAAGSAEVEADGVKPAGPVIQNRDRSTPAAITQMRGIAASPDYLRLSASRDFTAGAPVIVGDIPLAQLGRKETMAAGKRRIYGVYAVVEAAELVASHSVDGSANPAFEKASTKVIAGNGRTAGLQEAYRAGNANDYRAELEDDGSHGINPEIIRGMKAPVLVRVMPASEVTDDIGDISNTQGGLQLSAVEQARNDANRVDLDALEFTEDGRITPDTVRRFVQAMPQAEQGNLINRDGSPTTQAVDRLNAVVFFKAYNSEPLTNLYAQTADPDARNIMSALAQAATSMARLEGAGALDIRPLIAEAAEIAINGRRNGLKLSEIAAQDRLDADPDTRVILNLFASNANKVKPVAEALKRAADFAYSEANKPAADMFGSVSQAGRGDVVSQIGPRDEARGAQNLEEPAGGKPAGRNAEGQSPEGPGQGNAGAAEEGASAGQAEGLTLKAESEADAQAKAKREADALAAEQKAKADEQARLKREANKREADARAAEILAEREAAKKAEVDAAADDFALGQEPPKPVEKKVAAKDLAGQKDIFGGATPFADPLTLTERQLNSLRGKPITMKAQTEDGQVASWEIDAAEAVQSLRSREATIQQLVRCLS